MNSFLAPTGAQGVTLVRLSVRLAQSCLEHSIFIVLAQILHDDLRMTSKMTSKMTFKMTSG